MGRDFESRTTRVALVACSLAIALGLYVDARGFLVNILASVVAVAAGVLIAVRLVDPLLRSQRRRDWSRVSEATLASVRTHLIDIAVQVRVTLGGAHAEVP